jgi:chromosome segregation ATPase
MSFIFNWVFKTVVGRWVTASLIALLLSGGAWKWHTFKEDLIHKGQAVCVQEINKETVEQLQAALAAEKSASAQLRANLIAAAAVNQEARERRRELSSQLESLRGMMQDQRNNDETYREWSDSDLPDGVADRLRSQGTSDNPGPIRDDGN